MKKSQLIKIIKEETDSTIREFFGMFGSKKKKSQSLTKQVFVNQFNKKAKEVGLFKFPGREDMPLEMQEVEVSDNFINAIKRFHQLRASKQGKKEEIIQLSGNLAAIMAQSVKDNQGKGGSTTSGLTAMQDSLMRHIEKLEKLPERLIVTGDTAKVKFSMAGPGGQVNLRKKQALIQTYKKQLEKEHGGQWKFSGTKGEFAIFNKQQNVATTP